jgi:SSS family solute:Na+ symporter
MFLGFFLIVGFAWNEMGSPVSLMNSLPSSYLNPLGDHSVQYFFVWFFIAAWTFVDPGFYQRCAAAESPDTAKNGLLISIAFWVVFDCLTLLSGLYAIKLIQTDNALLVYPLLGAKLSLPMGIFGLFITGIFATIMSTIDSFSLISAITLGRDILWRIQRPKPQTNSIPMIKKGLVIVSFIALFLALSVPSVVRLFYSLGSVLIPGLILPFLYTLFGQAKILPEPVGKIWILLPVLLSMGWFFFSYMINESLLGIEPFYPGFLLSILLGLYFQKFTG